MIKYICNIPGLKGAVAGLIIVTIFFYIVGIPSCSIGIKSGSIEGRVSEVIHANDNHVLVKFDDGRTTYFRFSIAADELPVIQIGKINRIHYLAAFGISKVEILDESAESNR